MCFRWLKTIYQFLRWKCAQRNRGYSGEISLHHRRYCSGGFSNRCGRGSFSCGREGSITYSRRPSYCPPPSYCPSVPTSPSCSISVGYTCDTEGPVAVTGGEYGGTSGWDVTVGTVPVYGTGGGVGYEGSACHGGDLGGGSGYGYPAPPSSALTPGRVSDGPGSYSGGSGYAGGGFSGTELSPGGGGCAQMVQQKCPVVVPSAKTQQCKQSTHWPPSQKK